jgi:hypothetical protein
MAVIVGFAQSRKEENEGARRWKRPLRLSFFFAALRETFHACGARQS